MNKKKFKRILAMWQDGLDLKTCIQLIVTLSASAPLEAAGWIVTFLDEIIDLQAATGPIGLIKE